MGEVTLTVETYSFSASFTLRSCVHGKGGMGTGQLGDPKCKVQLRVFVLDPSALSNYHKTGFAFPGSRFGLQLCISCAQPNTKV